MTDLQALRSGMEYISSPCMIRSMDRIGQATDPVISIDECGQKHASVLDVTDSYNRCDRI